MEGDSSPLFNCNKMIEQRVLEEVVNEWITDSSVFLVDLKTDRDNNIRVFMDSDKGFTIEQCVELTRYLESRFDREIEDYQLTVSSYGITQPFVHKRQYIKYTGRNVDIDPLEGKPFTARIIKLKGNTLLLEKKLNKKEIKEGVDAQVEMELKDLKSAKPNISFNE